MNGAGNSNARNNNRCIASCGVRSDVLASCVGLCGREIHPTCAGMSTNWCRTRAFDEFLVFKCEECRNDEWRNIANSFAKLADLQNSLVEVMKVFSSKTQGLETRIKSLEDFTEQNAASQNETFASFKTSQLRIQNELKNIQSTLSFLSTVASPAKCNCVSEATFGKALQQQKIDVIKAVADEVQFYLSPAVAKEPSNSPIRKLSKHHPRSKKQHKQIKRPKTVTVSTNEDPPVILPKVDRLKWEWVHASNFAPDTTTNQVRDYIMTTFPGINEDVIVNNLLKKEKKRDRAGLVNISFKIGVAHGDAIKLFKMDRWQKGVKIREFSYKSRLKKH